jgi:glycosyltransferase involved in cell wall biosynthesis
MALTRKSSSKSPVILQLLPSLQSGGVERGTIEMAKAMKEHGFTPIVASSGGYMVKQLQQADILHITMPLNRKSPWDIYTNSRQIERIIKDHKVDIVHARSRAPAWSGYYAAKKTDCHFMTTFHGTYNFTGKWKKRYNSIMTKGECVIAISEFIARHIREDYTDVLPDRVVTIPRGVDLHTFDPTLIDEVRMMRLFHYTKIPSDLPLILFPARLTRWKGHSFLLEGLKNLPHRNFFCIIIGDDKDHSNYRQELEQTIRNYNIVGNVIIVDHSYDMPAAYFVSSLVACLSLDPEAFGRVAIEAMSSGIVVIACPLTGIKEACGDAAIYHERDDIAGIIGTLRRLRKDTKFYQEMSTKGVERAKSMNTAVDMEVFCVWFEEKVVKSSIPLESRQPTALGLLENCLPMDQS